MAFVRGIHRWPVDFPHKGPVMRKVVSFTDLIMSFQVVQIVKDKKHQQKVIDACTFLNMCPPPEFDDGETPIANTYQNKATFDSAFFGARGAMEIERKSRRRREADVYRIVQITDVHYDPEYAVVSFALYI